MNLLLDFAEREKHELFERDVRLSVIGDVDELPMSTRHALDSAMSHTANCRTMTLSLALSYGGRADIVNAARALAARAKSGEILPEEVTEELLRKEMSTHALPPVDLLVRTGGEFRVSDFLLFEAAYAELCFLPIMWPDFDAQALRDALEFFRGRERRFGLTPHQAQSAVTGVFKRGQTFDPVDSSSSRLAKEAANAEPR
jgi:undecaprenyl diphosphate synthase